MLFRSGLVIGLSGSAVAEDPAKTPPPPKAFGPRKNAAAPPAQAGEAAKVDTIGTFGGWQVQCTDLPAAAGQPATKNCGMVQVGKSDKNDQIVISNIINRVKQGAKSQTLMRALVPIGVYLPTGVAMEIDGTALEGRMNFTRCNPRACEAFGEASDVSLKKFLKGKVATFYIYDRPGNGYPVVFPLAGFAEGLTKLGKL